MTLRLARFLRGLSVCRIRLRRFRLALNIRALRRAQRLEIASVDLALKTLGPYLGRPIEDKLAIKLTEGDSAAVFLVSWDFIAADSVHEGAIKAAAETLAGADQHVVTLLETIKKRNLSALVEAVVRRNRALEQCSRALGIH